MADEGGVFVHDYYESRTDASYFTQDHILLADEYLGRVEDLPPYLKDCYTEAETYQNIHIYRAKINRMDGARGYACNTHSVDYCYTPGYTVYAGELTDTGSLLVNGDGEVCVSSPWMSGGSEHIGVTLFYETDSKSAEAGKLQVRDTRSHELIAEAPLQSGGSEISIPDIARNGRDLVVQVVVNEGEKAELKRFEYDQK